MSSEFTDAELECLSHQHVGPCNAYALAAEVLRLRREVHAKETVRAGLERRLGEEIARAEAAEAELAESQHGYALQITTVANGVRANRALLARAEAAEAELAEVSRNRDTSAVQTEADLALARGRQAEALSDYHRKITECNAAEVRDMELALASEAFDRLLAEYSALAAELARCRPVVEAALAAVDDWFPQSMDEDDDLKLVVEAYRAGENR